LFLSEHVSPASSVSTAEDSTILGELYCKDPLTVLADLIFRVVIVQGIFTGTLQYDAGIVPKEWST
jgi:hypothetical protein